MKRAAILTIGNEILNGSTLDTNSNWICKQVVGRGARVERISVVPDEPDVVRGDLERLLRLQVDLVVTLGGLGPTADDLTLASIAAAAGLRVELNQEALAIVNERYRALEDEGVVDPPANSASVRAREKMAWIPVGATPIFNPVGAAPATAFRVHGTTVLSLPGVPREVQSIVAEHAGWVFAEALGVGFFRTVTIMTDTNDESRLAEPAAFAAGQFSDVYVKTRPIKSKGGMIGITLSLGGGGSAEIVERLDAACELFESALRDGGIAVVSREGDE